MGRVLGIACAVVLVAGCGGGGDKRATACASQPMTHYVTYRVRAHGTTAVTQASVAATVKALCDQARAGGMAEVAVRSRGARIDVAGPLRPAGRLAFYDWEPNLLPSTQQQPTLDLFAAARMASRQKPRAEAVDLPSDHANDLYGVKYYVFGPGRTPLGGGPNGADAFYGSCREVAAAFNGTGACGAPGGSRVVTVPRGIVVLKDEQRAGSTGTLGYWVLEDDAELMGADIRDPKQAFDPQTNQPIVTFGFTDRGRRAFARVTKREADRGAQILRRPGEDIRSTFQTFAIVLDNQLVSRATVDYQQNPNGIPGDTGAQINGLGNIQETQDLARAMARPPLPLDLVRVGSR